MRPEPPQAMSFTTDNPHDPPAEIDQLLEQWQSANDVYALEQLLRVEVALLKARITKRGKGLIRPSQGVSDVAQEAILGMLRSSRRPRFENPVAFRAYLWKAAWRLLLRRLKKPGLNTIPMNARSSWALGRGLETTGGLGDIDRGERAVALDLALTLLPDTDRAILDLVYFQGLEIEEAADALDITRAAADMRLFRARQKLAKKLMDWNDLIG